MRRGGKGEREWGEVSVDEGSSRRDFKNHVNRTWIFEEIFLRTNFKDFF